ncbi:SDR family NAD(P)-dependent oxidoreductase [Nocardia donostiensis]|uniref:SDR family NAD(P)-dependent oxidoreductase n=1 Tax=Nocardia donostiensis TaxID=1538463 RepID=UPI0020CA4C09|nr:SDR family NAD(P)-dependent oxidoreductase [Nocardia donostiensis]
MTAADARRVCLLTGAGGTLGDAFCRALYTRYDIVAVCRARVPAVPSQHEWFVDPLDPAAQIPENDSRVFIVQADLTENGAAERVVDIALARFGQVDLLVNAAGHPSVQPFGVVDGEAALSAFEPSFAVHVGAPLRLATRLAQRGWVHDGPVNRSRNRNIVNVSSAAGSSVRPGGEAVYSASKAALNQLTRHMADEFTEFGVRVNAIAPDAFPAVVPTEQVVRAIVELDEGPMSGEIFTVGPLRETPAPVRHARAAGAAS